MLRTGHRMQARMLVALLLLGAITAGWQGELPTEPPPPAPTETPTPFSPPPSHISTFGLNPGEVVINEVYYDDLFPGDDGPYEWFELYNATADIVTLDGWQVGDNTSWDSIPPLTIPSGGFAVVAAGPDFYALYPSFSGTVVFLADGRIGGGLADTGDRLFLQDENGIILDALSYGNDTTVFSAPPASRPGYSLERIPPGYDTDQSSDFFEVIPSPGGPAVFPTSTPTLTDTPTDTPTSTPTLTDTPTDTPIPIETSTPTLTLTDTPTDTPIPIETSTSTPTLTDTPTDTSTSTPTLTDTPTSTPTLTDTPTDTPIPIETSTPTLTPTPAPTLPPGTLLISEVLYDGTIPGEEGDEMVELCNYGTATIPLDGCKIGDEEVPGGNEGMYIFPAGAAIGPGSCLVIAKSGVQFQSRFGFYPDFEFRGDTPQVPDMIPYPAWSSGRWALANGGDEVLLLGPDDRIVDAVAYGGGNFAALGLVGMAEATQPFSLQRIGAQDTDDMSADFLSVNPNPGQATYLPPPPDPPPPGLALPGGLRAYLGSFKSHTNLSDNCAPAGYIFALGRSAGLHFLGLSDPADSLDGPGWNYLARAAHEATEEGAFIALRGFEWHQEETGSFNVFATEDFLSPESPGGSTLEGFYSWLAARPEAIAQFNFSDNSFAYQAAVEEAMCLLETDFSGAGDFLACDARYLRSLQFGWHVAPAGNAAIYHPDCPPSQEGEAAWRTGVLAWALTETELLAALRAGRAFATQDENLALALRTKEAWMGAAVPPAPTLTLYVDFADPDGEPLTLVLFDQALALASTSFPAGAASGTWPVIVEGRAGHFFFAKAFQADGQVAYTAPIWVEGQTEPESLALNEILPAPHEVDWDGDGKADSADEWIELYNPTSKDIGLGDWQMDDVPDGGSKPFTFPPGAFIPARGFLVLYNRQTGLTLNNDGDTVRLLRPDGTVADEFTYSRSKYDRPWSRKDDGYGEWVDNYIPTPGQPNRPGAPTPTPTPETLPQRQWRSIAEARKLVPLTPLIVTGWVTVPPDLLESKRMYVQDLTGGIQVYLKGGGFPSMAEGDWVEIIGWMADYHGEREIRIATPADAMLLSGNRRPLAPQPIRTGQVGEEYEGLLVQIKGRATGCEEDKLYLDDGSGPAEVYFKSYAIRRPRAEEGQIFTVTGVVSQYAPKKPYMGGYRLLPRYESDIQPGE